MKSDFKKEGRREILKRITESARVTPHYLSNYFPKMKKDRVNADVIERNAFIQFLPAEGYPEGLSGHAQDIHKHFSQLVGAGGSDAVPYCDVIRLFGFPLRRPYGLPDSVTLRGFPAEELLEHKLIKIQDRALNKSK